MDQLWRTAVEIAPLELSVLLSPVHFSRCHIEGNADGACRCVLQKFGRRTVKVRTRYVVTTQICPIHLAAHRIYSDRLVDSCAGRKQRCYARSVHACSLDCSRGRVSGEIDTLRAHVQSETEE